MTWPSTLSRPHSPPAGQQGNIAAAAAPWLQQCSGVVLQLLTPDPGSPTIFARLGERCNSGVCQCLCHWGQGEISIILLPLEPVFSDLQIALHIWGFPGVSVVKNPLSVQETPGRSLGREDLLEEKMATHSSIPAWRSPRTEKPSGLLSLKSQKSRTQLSNEHTHTSSHTVSALFKLLLFSGSQGKTTALELFKGGSQFPLALGTPGHQPYWLCKAGIWGACLSSLDSEG